MLSRNLRNTAAALALTAMNSFAFLTATPAPAAAGVVAPSPVGTGLFGSDKLECLMCMAGGMLVVFTGAPAYAMLIAEPAITSGAIAECINACASAYK